MTISKTFHHPLKTTLLAMAMAMPLGCDSGEPDGSDGLEQSIAALELSPNQDLVELEEDEAVAFEAIDGIDEIDEFRADIDAQAAGSCTLLRPAGWSKPGHSCAEYYLPSGGQAGQLPMSNGETFITHAGYVFPGPGTGHARISCNNGNISIQSLSCQGGIIQ